MKEADGAFVGRLVDRDDIGQGQARLRFDVERAVKGNIGSTVDVVTANNSAACGIEMPMGSRTGLFLTRDGGRWTGTLCWQVSPEDMLAAATLPAPNGKWPAAMFVGGRFGPARTIALDAKGRTLGYSVGPGNVLQVTTCPGGRRLVELVYRGSDHFAVIRELPTFWPIREQRLPRPNEGVPSVRCVDTFGERLAVFTSGPDARGLLSEVTRQRVATLWHGTAFYASFWRDVAYVQVLAGIHTRIVRVDLRTGSSKALGAVRADGLKRLVSNAAGTQLGSASFHEGCRTAPCAYLVVIDLRRRPISARTVPDPKQCCGSTGWMRNDRLAYFSDGQTLLYTPTLKRVGRVSGWTAGDGIVVGRSAYGITLERALIRADLPAGKVRAVRRLPGTPEFIAPSR